MYQYVLCRQYYAECAVASFSHQIKNEYCGGNRSVSIDGIALEHSIETYQLTPSSYLHSFKYHAVFNYFLSYDIKQDADTTATHSKNIT